MKGVCLNPVRKVLRSECSEVPKVILCLGTSLKIQLKKRLLFEKTNWNEYRIGNMDVWRDYKREMEYYRLEYSCKRNIGSG